MQAFGRFESRPTSDSMYTMIIIGPYYLRGLFKNTRLCRDNDARAGPFMKVSRRAQSTLTRPAPARISSATAAGCLTESSRVYRRASSERRAAPVTVPLRSAGGAGGAAPSTPRSQGRPAAAPPRYTVRRPGRARD